MKPNMAEEGKGLPEGNEEVVQSKVDDGTDEKEGKNEEAVQMNVDRIEIGGSVDLGLQKSDKESGKRKVDDGSELVGSCERENVKRTQSMILGPKNKTIKTMKNECRAELMMEQKNVDLGTDQDKENVEDLETVGGKEADNSAGEFQEQGEGNQENNTIEQMESNLEVLMKSVEDERQLIEGFLGRVREVGDTMSREEIHQHLSEHLGFKLDQEVIIQKMMALSLTNTNTTTTGVHTIIRQTNEAKAGVSESVNNE